ncbi:hypothetical protein RUM44_005105 [Polyplax serrata]|uniref:Uncharacterized protein n=1 Tax=Polyplax serrata TaxID=468196 RepID=A0ABR1AE23_POLSC
MPAAGKADEAFGKKITIFLISTFALLCLGNQETSDLIKSSILRQNLSDKNLRLDPLLRKALLKALVELEKEAEEKLKAEETRSIRSEPSDSVGNFLQNTNEEKEEIQEQAEIAFASSSSDNVNSQPLSEVSVNPIEEPVFTTGPPVTQENFQYSTTPSTESEISNLVEEPKVQKTETVIQSSVETNFISEDVSTENPVAENNLVSTNKQEVKEGKKSESAGSDVDIFKAPLVAAFTLHQDSKGTPQSVIPLFNKQSRPNLFDQQYALYKQQQQQQFLQNQFIPSVALTPSPHHLNQFNQVDAARYFLSGTNGPSFTPSTVFPPLVSNSILQQSFTPIPTHFDSTTLPPFKTNPQNLYATLPSLRNFSPDSSGRTILPSLNGVSIVQSHSINLSPTPSQNFPPVTPPTRLQPLNIPPVTLPLQNEGRFQSPIIVPSPQTNAGFLDSQEQERIRNRLLAEEQNRKRLLEEQQRQRQIQEQNRQRQFEEERQRQLYEAQVRQRQQRQEQGVDFQRSVGFTFNQNVQSNFRNPLRNANNGFNFNIQPSQSFISPVNFLNGGHLRVNRQEGFGSTGNFGFSNHQQNSNNYQFQSNQIFPQLPEYRTIPDEHYRNTQFAQFNQNNNNRFNEFGQLQQQQQQQFNSFGRNNQEDVNKRLQNLLYQSGVTGGDVSGQEDLNIVSKVLALNHARSDANVDDTLLRSNRRVQPKGLGVGEIKDMQQTVL